VTLTLTRPKPHLSCSVASIPPPPPTKPDTSRFPRLFPPLRLRPTPVPTPAVSTTSLPEPAVPKSVQVAVMIAMPTPNKGAAKDMPADEFAEMGITEKVGGVVDIGVATYNLAIP
jgi:hypothetical protein